MQANASLIISSDDFEVDLPAASNIRGISLNTTDTVGVNANNTYTGAEGIAVNDGTAWRDVSNKYNALSESINHNARIDVVGNGGGIGLRLRAATGAATLDSAMMLTTLNATSVTMSYDVDLDDNSAYQLEIQYSSDAAFSSPITLATLVSDGTDNGGWLTGESVTITDGVDGVVFSDDAYFMIRKTGAAAAVNSAFHTFDNIVITAEVAAIPEPSSTALLGLGGLALLSRRKRC